MENKETDLTVIFYTANSLHEPFAGLVRDNLLKVIGDYPLISVSQKPMDFGKNINLGDIGRSHLNIYRQILIGCKEATTKYVGMAEDDMFYSPGHFKDYRPREGRFAYDMNKWGIFTWIEPAMYSYRHRKIVNSLIAERQMLIDAMEERFKRYDELIAAGKTEEQIIKYWGDPGRYEDYLGVTIRPLEEFTTSISNVVFSHEEAFGYESRGKRKKLGDPRAFDIPYWGKAEDMLALWFKE